MLQVLHLFSCALVEVRHIPYTMNLLGGVNYSHCEVVLFLLDSITLPMIVRLDACVFYHTLSAMEMRKFCYICFCSNLPLCLHLGKSGGVSFYSVVPYVCDFADSLISLV